MLNNTKHVLLRCVRSYGLAHKVSLIPYLASIPKIRHTCLYMPEAGLIRKSYEKDFPPRLQHDSSP